MPTSSVIRPVIRESQPKIQRVWTPSFGNGVTKLTIPAVTITPTMQVSMGIVYCGETSDNQYILDGNPRYELLVNNESLIYFTSSSTFNLNDNPTPIESGDPYPNDLFFLIANIKGTSTATNLTVTTIGNRRSGADQSFKGRIVSLEFTDSEDPTLNRNYELSIISSTQPPDSKLTIVDLLSSDGSTNGTLTKKTSGTGYVWVESL